jgi:hypothetical protein
VAANAVIMSPIPPMKTAEHWPDKAYWSARADRAIAANLIQTNAVLKTQLETLIIVRRSIGLVASVLAQDTDGWHRLGTRVADYHRADGRVQQNCKRLGTRLDRLVIKA